MARRPRDNPLPDFSAEFLERFADLQEIGSGGMARVFRARQKAIHRAVAIKLIHPLAVRDSATLQRFLQEARITASLSHPNIIKILDTGEEAELPYLVFELVEGKTLEERIQRTGPLPVTEALEIAADVADALAYAHERGVIHRDLKPENLLITGDGTVKIADFGLAKLEDSSRRLTGIGFSVGTPGYMSPEQVLGNEADGRSDVYAAGVMLYEMLTGALPYPSHNDMNVMLERMQSPYPPVRSRRPEVPESVETLLARALALTLEERIPAARDFREAILDIVRPDRTSKVKPMAPSKAIAPPKPARPARSWRRPLRLAGGVVAAVVLLGLAVFGVAAFRRNRQAGVETYDATGVIAMPGVRSARVYWNSSTPYRARVRFWRADRSEMGAEELEETRTRTIHDLTLTGLDPGTSLHYKILYPDGAQSLRYGLRVPDATKVEILAARMRATGDGTATFTWQTNVPARCKLIYQAGGELRHRAASRGYRTRHKLTVTDYPVFQGAKLPALECVACGGEDRLAIPLRSAIEAAAALERETVQLSLPQLVHRFDEVVRVKRQSAADLLPRGLLSAAAEFEGLAPVWFAEAPLARRTALYHALTNLEHLDAVWTAAGLDPPFHAAAVYRPFITTDYPEGPPRGTAIGPKTLPGPFIAAHAPPGLSRAADVTTVTTPHTIVREKLRLAKADLDAAERVWLTVQVHNLTVEEHFRIRVNGVLDLYFRPIAAGFSGLLGPDGAPLTEPPPRKATFVSRGVPAEFFHAGDNDLEVSFDSVPGVASLGQASIRSAWAHLERGR